MCTYQPGRSRVSASGRPAVDEKRCMLRLVIEQKNLQIRKVIAEDLPGKNQGVGVTIIYPHVHEGVDVRRFGDQRIRTRRARRE